MNNKKRVRELFALIPESSYPYCTPCDRILTNDNEKNKHSKKGHDIQVILNQ